MRGRLIGLLGLRLWSRGRPDKNRLNALWFEQARQIAEAGRVAEDELAAGAAAFPAPLPSSPSAAQVAAAFTAALTAQQTYLAACVTLKQAEADTRAARGLGQRLLAALRRRLAGQFHELPPETRRREMMKFGVRYATAPSAPAREQREEPISQPEPHDQALGTSPEHPNPPRPPSRPRRPPRDRALAPARGDRKAWRMRRRLKLRLPDTQRHARTRRRYQTQESPARQRLSDA